jgi:hypothetical protein
MANNYTCFSFVVTLPSAADAEAALALKENDEEVEKLFPEHYDDWSFGCKGNTSAGDHDDLDLWIYAEESGNVEAAADFVVYLLNKHDLPPVDIEWCSYCDKPRVNEFCGGAIFVTKDGPIYQQSSYTWLQEQRKAYDEAHKKAA